MEEVSFIQNARVPLTVGTKERCSAARLKIDPKAFRETLYVGFVEKDGCRTKPIKAFVDEKLKRLDRKAEKGK